MNMRIIFVSLVSVLLLGCSSSPVKLQIESSSKVNLNEYNKPLPVVLKIYQLSDASAMNSASFTDLWKDEQNCIGDSLLAKKELTVLPGSNHEVSLVKEKKASHIGVFASFRKPGEDGWKVLKPINNGFFSKSISLRLSENKIKSS